MARFASLTLSIFVLAGAARALPQEEDPRLKPALKASELKSLNRVAQKWIASELKWDEDPKQRTKRDRALQKFKLDLEKKSKSVDVLANVGNMLGDLRGCVSVQTADHFGRGQARQGGYVPHPGTQAVQTHRALCVRARAAGLERGEEQVERFQGLR